MRHQKRFLLGAILVILMMSKAPGWFPLLALLAAGASFMVWISNNYGDYR